MMRGFVPIWEYLAAGLRPAPDQWSMVTTSPAVWPWLSVVPRQAFHSFDSPRLRRLSLTPGAFDLISREAMLQGLSEVEGGGSVLPLVKLFHSCPSMYCGQTMQEALMRCGRRRADWRTGRPLMPALCACGQHRAFIHVSEELLDSERLFAFMDDVCCGPDHVAAIHQLLE